MPGPSGRRRSVVLLVAVVAAPLLAVLAVAGPAAARPGPSTPSTPGTSGPPGTPSRTAQTAAAGPVVLLGTGGLRWDDVDSSTPALQSLLDTGAVGTLAVRTVRRSTCPVDGWLTVSAGRRAGDAEPIRGHPSCRPPEADAATPGGPATARRWDVFRSEAADGSFGATPGLLGTTLAKAGVRTAAVGPGAVVALADESGRAPAAWPGLTPLPTGAPDPAENPTDLADQARAALADGAQLVVVDIGAVRDRDDRAEGEPVPATTGSRDAWPTRQEQVDTIDTRLLAVLGELPDDATVLVASTADSGSTPHLQLLAATGPTATASANGSRGRYADALLGSRSTRQDGMGQTTDLFPTLLAALGVDAPADAVGSPLTPVAVADGDALDRLERVVDLDAAALAVQPVVPAFFNVLIAAQLVLYGIATIVLRRRTASPAARRRVLHALRGLAVVFASVPAATFLANLLPWWRGQHPGPAVSLYVASFVVPIAVLALAGPWRNALLGPFGIVGAVTALVLAADVVTGSHLVLSSLMGVQPVVAGRFYGFSNPGFALFATGCLLAAIASAHALVLAGRRRAAVGAVVAIGLACLVIDGAPGLGSDFGGPPAIVPAFTLLALWVAGVRLTWRRLLLIGAATLVVLVGLSVLDWLRPPADRTHLGRFVQTVADGGAWPVVRRKAMQNLGILIKPLSALLPFAVAFVALVLARPVAWGARPLQLAYDRSPVLRHGLASFAVLVGIGFALNDSGTAIPAVAATVAIPLLIAASVRALELHEEEHPPPNRRVSSGPGVQPGASGRARPRTRSGASRAGAGTTTGARSAPRTGPRAPSGGSATPSRPPSTASRAPATAPPGDGTPE